jgi:predicted nucleic acid-binding protein
MQVDGNTAPLSALSIIGRLGLLRAQLGTIRIPNAVWTELSRLEHASGKQAPEQAHAEGWIENRALNSRLQSYPDTVTSLPRSRISHARKPKRSGMADVRRNCRERFRNEPS